LISFSRKVEGTAVQIRVLNSPGKPGLPLYLQGFILDSIF
jgi:hypothetical protein